MQKPRSASPFYSMRTLALIFGAVVGATVGWLVLSHFLGETDTAKAINVMLFGSIIIGGDAYVRYLNREDFSIPSLFRSSHGTPFAWAPGWLVGVAFIAGGVILLVDTP